MSGIVSAMAIRWKVSFSGLCCKTTDVGVYILAEL